MVSKNKSVFELIHKIVLAVVVVCSATGGAYSFVASKDKLLDQHTKDITEVHTVVNKVVPEVSELSKQVGLIAQSVDNNAKAINSLQATTEKLVVNVAILEDRVMQNKKK